MPLPSPLHRTGRGRLAAPVLGTLLTTLVGSVLAATPATADPPEDRGKPGGDRAAFTLTLLHANDLESQLLGIDVDVDGDGTISPEEERSFGGAARFATLADQLERQATTGRPGPGAAGKRGSLLLSSGDNFLAGPEFAAGQEEGAAFHDALAMQLAGFDASAIGNHEFDFGPDVLAHFIGEFGGEMPFVSANLDVSGEPRLAELADDGTIVSRTVLKEKGERIGIVGLTTPELPTVSSPRDVEVSGDLTGLAQAQVDALEEQGIDKVILLSHLQDIDEELDLVPTLSGVDVVIGGGGGELMADPDVELIPGETAERDYPLVAEGADGAEVPVVATRGDWAYLGQLVVHFDRQGEVLGYDDEASRPVRVSGIGDDAVEPDPEVERLVTKPVSEHVAEMDDTVVAQSEVPLNGVRNDVRTRETNLGSLLADAMRWAGEQQADAYDVPAPQVGIQNGGGIRNDSVIPAGEVTELDTFDIAPFSNFVSVIPEVSRETFRQLLERGVASAPDAGGQFIQISGATFSYDVAGQAQEVDEGTGEILTPGERVQSVVLDDGTVVVEDGEVVAGSPIAVATNDFSARGGDAYPLAGLDFTPVGKTYQQALQEYLEDGLGGQVTAEDYPVGGEGRITQLP